jgi:multidrug efflux pump subunit AcrA (membrane-fusion protein)
VKARPRLRVPSPRRPRRLPLPRRPLECGLAIAAAALVAIGVTSLGGGSSTSSAATKRTATVGKGVVQSTVSGNGTLEPAQKLELSFGASGEVTKIYVKAGEKVTKGEVLAEVDSSSARASVASAEAQLLEAEEAVEAAAEAEEEEAEDESEGVAYEGGAITELVGFMSKEGTAAAEEPAKEEAAEAAGGEKSADKEPEAGGKGTEAAGNESGATAKESEAAKGGAEAGAPAEEESIAEEESAAPTQGGEAAAGEASAAPSGASTEAAASTESSGSAASGGAASGSAVSLPTAEANLREAELSVKSARQEVRETTLRAPISGTIASVSGSVGETVTGGSSGGGGSSEASSPEAAGGESTSSDSGSAFMVLAQLRRLKLEVSFSEADIGKVRKGQTATVAVDSMEGTELAGRVTKVSVLPSEASSGVVEYPATIVLTQSAKGLRAGMSATAEVVVEQVKNAITVPSEALTGKSVTVEEGGEEVTKTVTTGLVGDETTQILSGLKAGETLVLPEVSVATASPESGGSETGGVPGGGALPSFGGGAGGFTPPSGGAFPGGR